MNRSQHAMSYFPDLSPYNYGNGFHPGVLHVGWLDGGHEYPKGTVAREILEKLKVLAKEPVQLYMGHHLCTLCPPHPERLMEAEYSDSDELRQEWADWESPRISNGEIRVTFQRATYAAPVLIVHNIEKHGYQPPAIFLRAVMEGTAYQPLGFISQLPDDMLSSANLESGKPPAWRVSDFARVLQRATAHRLACLGGQFELRRPDGSVEDGLSRVCDWTRLKGQSWDEYVEFANAFTRQMVEVSVSEKDPCPKMLGQKSVAKAIASAKMADPLAQLYFAAQFGGDPEPEIAKKPADSQPPSA